MPYHKIPRAYLHEDVRKLEQEHEIVVWATPNPDPEFMDVFTRYCHQSSAGCLHTRGGAA